MTRPTKRHKKKLVNFFIKNLIHVWFIVFIANVVIFYSVRFYINASTEKSENETAIIAQNSVPTTVISSSENAIDITISPSVDPGSNPSPTTRITLTKPPNTPIPTKKIQTPTPKPKGPVIAFSFTMPGISSIGGNIKPNNPVRDVDILLYSPNGNISDKSVKPVYVIKAKAKYADDPQSQYYTSFINEYVDLGPEVTGKNFQIVLKTRQALIQVIKDPEEKSIGGEIFSFKKSSRITQLPTQEMIVGDIYPVPESDNVIDINDYNMMKDCFGIKATTKQCISGSTADLDDNGIVDGIDYNLLALSFQKLKEMGLPIPVLQITPDIIINPTEMQEITSEIKPTSAEPTEEIAPTKVATKSSSGGVGGIIFVILLLILFGTSIFVAIKFHLLDKIMKKKVPSSNNTPENSANNSPQESTEEPVQENASQEAVQQPSQDVKVNDQQAPIENNQSEKAPPPAVDNQQKPQENTEKNMPNQTNQAVSPAPEKPAQENKAQPAAPAQSQNTQTPTQSGVIEKSGYLKVVSTDKKTNETWVTIADDTGVTKAVYKGSNVANGFAKIKGTIKTDNDKKPYIEISELTPDE